MAYRRAATDLEGGIETRYLMKITVLSPLLVLALAFGCGGSEPTPTSSNEDTSGAEVASAELTHAQLGKLDAGVRAELRGSNDAPIPVRVEFVHLPRADELSEFLLVPYEDVAIGRVSKQIVRALALRDDVTHIAMLSGGGYADDAEEFEEL